MVDESSSQGIAALGDKSIDELLDVYECLSLIHRVWPPDLTGKVVGSFELIQELGSGGMGTVWKAIQREPIQRYVAIKLIKPQASNPRLAQRFADERQVLAQLNHPNIARIVEAGSTDSGQLFFAMELVSGENILDYCDKNQLKIEDRIQLFTKVCDAIQHAHQQGVIHRDIKPSNVLVQEVDGKPMVKVIDFGLAKLLSHDDSVASISKSLDASTPASHSVAGTLIGSLAYMSPEQTGLVNTPVDIRTDVYSLGLMLSELLTGKHWFDDATTRQEVLEAICYHPLRLPSEIVAGLSDSSKRNLSQSRQSAVNRIQKQLRLDLDWIVAKATNKQPAHRFQSVTELAGDLVRFLQTRPIVARPKSVGYEFNKMLRRNPIAASSAMVVLGLIVVSTCLLSWAFLKVSAAESLAVQRLEQSKKSNVILAEVFDGLNADAIENANRPFRIQIADRLLEASDQVSELSDVRTVIELQNRLARALVSMGSPKEARELSEKAFSDSLGEFGISDQLTRACGRTFAAACAKSGDLVRALEVSRQIINYCELELGPIEAETLELRSQYAEQLWESGQEEKSRAVYEETIAGMELTLGPEDFRTLDAMNGLATTYLGDKEGEKVIPLLTKYCERCERTLRRGHAKTILGLSKLAWAYSQSGESELALPPAAKAFDLAMKNLGARHPLTYETQVFLAIAQFVNGETNSAIESIRVAGDGLSETLGESYPRTIVARKVLARFLMTIGRPTASVKLMEVVSSDLEGMKITQPVLIDQINELAGSYARLGEFGHARELLKKCLASYEDISPKQKWMLINSIGEHFFAEGQYVEAVAWFRQANKGAQQELGPFNFLSTITVADLAKGLAKDGQTKRAISLLNQYQEQIANAPQVSPIQKKITTAQLGIVLMQDGQVDRGIELMEAIANSKPRLKEWNYLVAELRRGYYQQGSKEKIRDSIEQQLRMIPPLHHRPGMIYKAGLLLGLAEETLALEQYELAGELLATSQKLYQESFPDSWENSLVSLLIEYSRINDQVPVDIESLNEARDLTMSYWDQTTSGSKRRIARAIQGVCRRLDEVESRHADSWRDEMPQVIAPFVDRQ